MSERHLAYSQYLAPRYWLLWIALGLAFAIAWLPLRLQQALGALLGCLAFMLLKRRRKITSVNIQACFPELSDAEQQALVKASFISNGRGVVEALRSWFRAPESLKSCTRYYGDEYLQAALEKGKGVILLGGHYSTLDLVGSLTTMYFEADVLQRDHSNPLFNAFMTRSRQKLYGEVLDKFDLRGMLKCLKRNRVVWYATDQDGGRIGTVFAPFFGIPCATLVSTGRLARRSGATVLPFSHFRRTDGLGYDIHIHPPLEDFPSDDDYTDATRLNTVLEREIRKNPEQYLWMHRRFKTPEQVGAQNLYGQIRD